MWKEEGDWMFEDGSELSLEKMEGRWYVMGEEERI